MRKLHIALILSVCSLGLGAQLLPLEEKIIGTWQFGGVDDPGRIVIRGDHTCATMFPMARRRGWEVIAKGTWRIDGDYLIRVEKPWLGPTDSGNTAGPSVTSKLRIRSIAADSFRLGDGPPMKRIK